MRDPFDGLPIYFLWLVVYMLISPACPISGLLHIIAYIRQLIIEAYGVLSMWVHSASVMDDHSLDSLKWLVKRVLSGLASYMLNF